MKQIILNRNEIIAGPAPACLRAIHTFDPNHVTQYIENYYTSLLVPQISQTFGVPEHQIILGQGCEQLLSMILNYAEGGCVLTHTRHYIFYDKFLQERHIPLHEFILAEKNKEFVFDITDCLKQYKKTRPKVLLITSPNNPTGNSISLTDVKRILETVSKKCLVVIDEAYWGVDKKYQEKEFLSLLVKHGNLVLLRTFSKLYALAGLRIGFALCGKNAAELLNYQRPYLGFSRILEEVAVAALTSPNYYNKLSQKIIKDREVFIARTNKLKHFVAYTSHATFVLVKVSEKALPVLQEHIAQSDFVISKIAFDNYIRVSLEPKKYTKEFSKLLTKVDRIVGV